MSSRLTARNASAVPGVQAVLHFWASWSEPCKHMHTVAAELAKEYPTVTFQRVRTLIRRRAADWMHQLAGINQHS